MSSIDFKNKMWLYSSILFMGSLLMVTLTVIGYYGLKAKGLAINPGAGIKNDISIALKDKQITDLQNQNKSLQKELTTLKSRPAANIDVYNNLMQAEDFANSGDYASAINLMSSFNANTFQGYAKDKYLALVDNVNANAALSFYTDGITAYRNADYQTASDQLSKAVQYGPTQSFADRAAYYASLSFKALGDTNNEKKYLQIVINNYPKSAYQYKAKLRYNSLT